MREDRRDLPTFFLFTEECPRLPFHHDVWIMNMPLSTRGNTNTESSVDLPSGMTDLHRKVTAVTGIDSANP